MGTRWFLMTAVWIASATSAFAQKGSPPPGPPAPGPLPAADLEKQGLDLYKAGDYAGAVGPLTKAYEMEPNKFEYRFALAQALRQSGQCGEAVPHYKALIDSAPDPATGRDVRASMEKCPNTGVEQPPTPPPPPAPPPAPPPSHGGISGGDALMLVGAGAGIAAGASLFFASQWQADDADAAAGYNDHVRIADRVTGMRIAAIVAGGVGITLGVVSIVRLSRSKHESADIAVTPRTDGGAFVVRGSW